jgi:glycosyltransferase involved in cell wall biosynthesis
MTRHSPPSLAAASYSCAILIPCYNEAQAVAGVVEDFRTYLPGARIFVFDNNSTDGTAEIAARAGAEVRHAPLQGKGHVVRKMFADIDADTYVLVDGDGTYRAEDARRLLDELVARQLDLVNGKRVTEAERAYRGGHRLGNWLLSTMARWAFGGPFEDMLSGLKVFSRRYVKSFAGLSRGFEIETELTIHAVELDMTVGEWPIAYAERPADSPSKLNTYRDGFRILATILRLIRIERPLAFFMVVAGILAIASLAIGIPVIVTFLEIGLVPRLPSAVLALGLMILSGLCLFTGLILDTVTCGRREAKRISYLMQPSLAVGQERRGGRRRDDILVETQEGAKQRPTAS